MAKELSRRGKDVLVSQEFWYLQNIDAAAYRCDSRMCYRHAYTPFQIKDFVQQILYSSYDEYIESRDDIVSSLHL